MSIENVKLQYTGNNTGTAVYFADSSDLSVTDVEITNAHYGLFIGGVSKSSPGCQRVYCTRVKVLPSTTSHSGVFVTGGVKASSPDDTGNHNIHFTDCVVFGSAEAAAPNYAYWFENACQVFMINCNQRYSNFYGILIYPIVAASSTHDMWFSNCSWDSNDKYGCWIGPASGLTSSGVKNINFTNCLFTGTNKYYGVALIAPGSGYAFSGINFNNCTVSDSTWNGFVVQYADHVRIVACSVYGSGSLTAAYSGISIVQSSSVIVAGCLLTGFGTPQPPGATPTQEYGVDIGAGCTYISVNACDVSGNSVASGINLALANGATCFINNNVGYNPVGLLTVAASFPSVPLSGSPHYAQNTTGTAAWIYINGPITAARVSNSTSFPSGDMLKNVTQGAPIRLDPGQYIQLTYVTAPTWQWVLD